MNVDIYNMRLHEKVEITVDEFRVEVVRVPGGWLYKEPNSFDSSPSYTFVPFNNEFQEVK